MIKETEVLTDLYNAKAKINVLALYDNLESWMEINKKIDLIISEIKDITYGKE